MSIASCIEHTRLAADTRPSEIALLCDEAVRYGFAGVCVNPSYVAMASQRLEGSKVRVVSVVGFPLGACHPQTDADSAERCVGEGAHEVDMVIPIGRALDADLDAVQRHVAAVKKSCGDAALKVILETGYFAPEALTALARAAIAGGADYLKTSTGFGPRGATVEDIETLAAVANSAPRPILIKASGSIRSLAQARALLSSGASRIGTSSGVSIAREEQTPSG